MTEKRATTSHEGRTDPARTLALLWGEHSTSGRTGLGVDAIVAAAIELADAEGLEAVSMRRLADRLGVGAMSLYTHVPGKAVLVDLMQDATLADLYTDTDEPARAGGGWRGGVEFVVDRNWDLYRRHPWLLHIVGARPVLGPNTSRKYEAELRPLDGIGLTDVEMDAVLSLVLSHVTGTARLLVSVEQTARDSGLTDAQWWAATAPILERLLDPAAYPVSDRVGSAAGREHQAASSPQHALRFGLDRILDGVDALVHQRAPLGQPSPE
ncbi:TetR/AcrR family transcriptional regulator [Rhodococcus sp. NPDC127528]|uniref:TetR/AcrR family transcriptional regulator n=1 Tax=unclassified Rhodococcus (in: high G+C Gram-positive bacteria) TaxID=192944 RepID=UPI00364326FC